jgi:hypothetical protein
LVPATTILPSLWSRIDVMNVAGVAAEAGGDATAVSECGLSVVADEYFVTWHLRAGGASMW